VVLANEVAKTGKEMLYLNIGDPNIYDFAPPRHMIDATYEAMLKNHNGYSPSSGIKAALDAIGRDADKKGIKIIQDIFITTGASEAIDICLTALVNEGDIVLTFSLVSLLYTAIARSLCYHEITSMLDETNGWQSNIEDIRSKVNSSSRAIILINPNNPTGSSCSVE